MSNVRCSSRESIPVWTRVSPKQVLMYKRWSKQVTQYRWLMDWFGCQTIGVWKKKAITASVSAALLTHLIYAPFVQLYRTENLKVVRSFAANWKKAWWIGECLGWNPHTSKVSSFFERLGKLGWMATTCQGVVKSFLLMFCHFGAGYFEVKYPRRCRDVFRMFEGFSIEFSKKMIGQYNWMHLQRAFALVVFPFHFFLQLNKPGTRSDSSICHGVI